MSVADPPRRRSVLSGVGRGNLLGEVLDKISQFSLIEPFGGIFGHAGLSPSALFDLLRRHRDDLAGGGHELHHFGCLFAEHAGVNQPVVSDQDNRLEPLCDLRIRQQYRLKMLQPGLALANRRQVWTDCPSLPTDHMATAARRSGIAEEDLTAPLGIPPGNALAMSGQDIVLRASLKVLTERCLEGLRLKGFDCLHQIEFHLRGQLPDGQRLELGGQDRLGGLRLQAGQYAHGGLLLARRALQQNGGQLNQRSVGIGARQQSASLGPQRRVSVLQPGIDR